MTDRVIAYTIPYASYRLWLCLRCAAHGLDDVRRPETVLPLWAVCDRCRVKIKEER